LAVTVIALEKRVRQDGDWRMMVDTVSATVKRRTVRVPIPSVDSSLGTKLLPTVLSVIAGSVDVISFLGLGGLFTAHVTGNLVILAAHLVDGGQASSRRCCQFRSSWWRSA
jgi:hypothetical protein